MSTSPRRRATRLAMSLVVAAGALTGVVALPMPLAHAAPASSHRDQLQKRLGNEVAPRQTTAVAGTCVDASSVPAECPTIISVSVGSAWIRSSTTIPITYSVQVVVDDPAGIALEMETYMGRGIDQWPPIVLVGYGQTLSPTSVSGMRKTFTMTVESPYTPLMPDFATPPYGGFQINPVVWGADPAASGTDNPNVQLLAERYLAGSIKAQSAVTNTPSAALVRKGGAFTERGRLARFDGTPQGGQKVNVYYVPAGQTKSSYAGTATTSSTGAWSLPVRSWFTGSWFVSYPGSVFSTSVYKGVWIRVS
jgi:hypothetical protein